MPLQLMCMKMNIVKLTQSITVQNVMWQHFQRRNKHGVIRHHCSPLMSLQPHSYFVPYFFMGRISKSSQKKHSSVLAQLSAFSPPLLFASLYLCCGALFLLEFLIIAIIGIIQFYFHLKNNPCSCQNSNCKEKAKDEK